MKIESPRFGTLEVSPNNVIEFPRGIPGFEDLRRFSLFHVEEAAPKFFILQSLDDPAVAFHLGDPALFGFMYEITLPDEDAALIDLKTPSEAAVAVMLVKVGEQGSLSANLKAPIIINARSRKAIQHLLSEQNNNVAQASS